MTIVILFHQSGYRTFKQFYKLEVCGHLKKYFPKSLSYSWFIRRMSHLIFPLHCYLQTRLGKVSGISFVDSTPIVVCHNRRIYSHKVFKGMAKKGKSSTGWFFGFKLHIIVSDTGELLAFCFTPGNTDDRVPVPNMTENIVGKLIADKGYISKKLFTELYERGLQLITKIKSNMKNKLMKLSDKLLLRKRGIIETVNDQLKNISQIEHSRHRSPFNFIVNLYCALIAYTHQEKKPSLKLNKKEIDSLPLAI
tara:strand:+ start:330 stop:1082 length:753 start_codon:yes stop_codon:yes gene_type:complete